MLKAKMLHPRHLLIESEYHNMNPCPCVSQEIDTKVNNRKRLLMWSEEWCGVVWCGVVRRM